MAGEIRQWNPGKNNQMSDADYLNSAVRTDGAEQGIFHSDLLNKFFYQVSTMAKAFSDMLAGKGATISDADLAVLTEAMRIFINSSPVTAALTGNTTLTYTSLNKTILLGGTTRYTVTIPATTDAGCANGAYLHFINIGTGIVLISGGGYTVYLYPGDEITLFARPSDGSSAWYGVVKRPPTSGEISESNTSATKTANLGNVIVGERYEFRSFCDVASGSSSLTPENLARIVHAKSSGSATILFGGEMSATWGGLNISKSTAEGSHESIVKVTGSGSLIMASSIQVSYTSTPNYHHYVYCRRL